MITKLTLVDRAYLSAGAMAAAHQDSYLLLHQPTPWTAITVKISAVVILLAVCIQWITK
jgi:hypothetical protein